MIKKLILLCLLALLMAGCKEPQPTNQDEGPQKVAVNLDLNELIQNLNKDQDSSVSYALHADTYKIDIFIINEDFFAQAQYDLSAYIQELSSMSENLSVDSHFESIWSYFLFPSVTAGSSTQPAFVYTDAPFRVMAIAHHSALSTTFPFLPVAYHRFGVSESLSLTQGTTSLSVSIIIQDTDYVTPVDLL